MRRPSHSPTMSTNRRQRIFALIGFLNVNPIPLNEISNASYQLAMDHSDTPSDVKYESSEGTYYAVRTCLPDHIPNVVTTERNPESTDAFFQDLESYNLRNSLALPQISEEEPSWAHASKLKTETHKKDVIQYCKNVGSDDIIYDYLNHNAPIGISVSHPGVDDQTIPTFKLDCDLRQVTDENSDKDIAGLYSGGHEKYALIQEQVTDDCTESDMENESSKEVCRRIKAQSSSVIFHEGVHLYNEIRWGLKGNPEYLAGELFGPKELDILGIQPCTKIDYDLLGEMAADGFQMMKSDFDNAFDEWEGAANHASDEYRSTYWILSQAYFDSLRSPEDLRDYINSLDESDEILKYRVQLVGKTLFTIAQKGLEQMRAIGNDDVHKLARK